jgi:hypothetical protein
MKKMLAAATSVSITLLASGLGFAQTDGTQSSNARPAAARDMTNAPDPLCSLRGTPIKKTT